ncbi:MAG: SDR family oxidoreductase [Spirochaetales bacterium]
MSHLVVTGSTRGIGLGMARRFLEKGHLVTVNGTTTGGLEAALKTLRGAYPGAPVEGLAANLAEAGSAQRLWDFASARAPVDVWINNHGVTQSSVATADLPRDEIRRVLDINLLGMIEASQVAVNGFRKQGKGTLLNMEGFGSNDMVNDTMAIYGTSKRALTYFTKALVAEYKGTPLTVCWLSPGMVTTDLLLHDLPASGPERDRMVRLYNILADRVETVAPWLADRILAGPKHGDRIAWLTGGKAAWRFATAAFVKRNVMP